MPPLLRNSTAAAYRVHVRRPPTCFAGGTSADAVSTSTEYPPLLESATVSSPTSTPADDTALTFPDTAAAEGPEDFPRKGAHSNSKTRLSWHGPTAAAAAAVAASDHVSIHNTDQPYKPGSSALRAKCPPTTEQQQQQWGGTLGVASLGCSTPAAYMVQQRFSSSIMPKTGCVERIRLELAARRAAEAAAATATAAAAAAAVETAALAEQLVQPQPPMQLGGQLGLCSTVPSSQLPQDNPGDAASLTETAAIGQSPADDAGVLAAAPLEEARSMQAVGLLAAAPALAAWPAGPAVTDDLAAAADGYADRCLAGTPTVHAATGVLTAELIITEEDDNLQPVTATATAAAVAVRPEVASAPEDPAARAQDPAEQQLATAAAANQPASFPHGTAAEAAITVDAAAAAACGVAGLADTTAAGPAEAAVAGEAAAAAAESHQHDAMLLLPQMSGAHHLVWQFAAAVAPAVRCAVITTSLLYTLQSTCHTVVRHLLLACRMRCHSEEVI